METQLAIKDIALPEIEDVCMCLAAFQLYSNSYMLKQPVHVGSLNGLHLHIEKENSRPTIIVFIFIQILRKLTFVISVIYMTESLMSIVVF